MKGTLPDVGLKAIGQIPVFMDNRGDVFIRFESGKSDAVIPLNTLLAGRPPAVIRAITNFAEKLKKKEQHEIQHREVRR